MCNWAGIFTSVLMISTAAQALEIVNFNEIAAETGLRNQYRRPAQLDRKIKVAIFDQSFEGYEKSDSLPEDTQLIKAPQEQNVKSPHGVAMAEIVTAFMTGNGLYKDLSPELYLIEVGGFSNFKAAVDRAIELEVDVILHSLVTEYGSNFNGRGFFNTEVNRATDAGIIWVNSAGNFNNTTYNLRARSVTSDNWLMYPGPNNSLPIRCTPPEAEDKCNIRLVLSWSDFKDQTGYGTDKDLDLYLFDDTLEILVGSNLKQLSELTDEPGASLYPREIINYSVPQGRYLVRVKKRSDNFSGNENVRVSGQGQGLSFEYYDNRETLNNPADNPSVITVGSFDDQEKSSRSISLNKPDVFGPSKLHLASGEVYAGTSNAAAIFAAAVAISLKQGTPAINSSLIESLSR